MGRDHWVVRLLAEPRISPFVGLLFVRGVNQRYRPVPTCEQFEAPLELHELRSTTSCISAPQDALECEPWVPVMCPQPIAPASAHLGACQYRAARQNHQIP